MNESNILVKLGGVVVNIPYDTPDNNGRIYPKDVMEKAIREYNRKIQLKERKEKINKLRNEINLEK